ncbi:hypothetical protein [Nesterenkonia suensis]
MMHRFGAAAGICALSLMLTACDDSENQTDDEASEEAAGGADQAAESPDAEDGAGSAEASESHGEATWLGDELVVERVSCSTGRPEPDIRQIRAGGDDFDLTIQLIFDRSASDDDTIVLAADDVGVEIFFPGEGGTIGDGEGYRGSTQFGADADGDADAVSGSLHLDPDSVSRAAEVTPDGGELTFSLTCGTD